MKLHHKSKSIKYFLKLPILLLIVTLFSTTGIANVPLKAYADTNNYTADIAATNSNAGAYTDLTFTTNAKMNAPILKEIVLNIPSAYSLDNVSDPIGQLTIEGIPVGYINNGEILTFNGNSNTYTYQVNVNASNNTVTIEVGTDQRSTFPRDVEMVFKLKSNMLKNPVSAGTYTWRTGGTDYFNNVVNLPDLTTAIIGGNITPPPPTGDTPPPPVTGDTTPPPTTGNDPGVPSVPVGHYIPGEDNSEYNQNVLNMTPTAQDQQAAQILSSSSMISPSSTVVSQLTANDGVKLVIPPGALTSENSPVKMSVNIGTIKTVPKADNTVVVLNPLKYQRTFAIEGQAEGTVQFSQPVTISFPISSADLETTGLNAKQLAIYWWNSEKNDWVKLGGSYDPNLKTISVSTYHFSTYAVMAETIEAPARLSGNTQIDTAATVADYGWKTGADTVVLVNAYRFPDALAASPLAYKYNAPILLTAANALSPAASNELKKLDPQKIIIVGGTAVVSQTIENELVAEFGKDNVKRYSGLTLYDTAAEVAKDLGTKGKAVVVNGMRFQDAVSISSYAAYNGIPILFTQKDVLPDATANTLKTLNVTQTYIAGGTAMVSDETLFKLPGANRYAGLTAADTAKTIAEQLKLNLNHVYVVTSLNFPDALVAGNLAAHTLSPLVMVDKNVPPATLNLLNLKKGSISSLTTIGGNAVVTPLQDSVLRAAIE